MPPTGIKQLQPAHQTSSTQRTMVSRLGPPFDLELYSDSLAYVMAVWDMEWSWTAEHDTPLSTWAISMLGPLLPSY